MTCRGLNMDSNLNSAAWPMGSRGRNPRIIFVEIEFSLGLYQSLSNYDSNICTCIHVHKISWNEEQNANVCTKYEDICSKNANIWENMQKLDLNAVICSKYAQNMTLHRLQYADMQNICTKYADICKKYTKHIHKYASTLDMHKICNYIEFKKNKHGYAKNLQKICMKYAWVYDTLCHIIFCIYIIMHSPLSRWCKQCQRNMIFSYYFLVRHTLSQQKRQ